MLIMNVLKYWCLYAMYFQVSWVLEQIFSEVALLLLFVFLLWNNFRGSDWLFDVTLAPFIRANLNIIVNLIKFFENTVGGLLLGTKSKLMDEYNSKVLPKAKEAVLKEMLK